MSSTSIPPDDDLRTPDVGGMASPVDGTDEGWRPLQDDVGGGMAAPPAPPSHSGPRGFALLAWGVIVLAVSFLVWSNQFAPQAEEADPNPDDPVGLMLMDMQAKYFVFANNIGPDSGLIYGQSGPLNLGSIAQRQRYVVLAADLAGADEALKHMDALESDLLKCSDPDGEHYIEPTDDQLRVNTILRTLYGSEAWSSASEQDESDDAAAADEARPAVASALTPDDQVFLLDQLDWFGELALNPRDAAATQTSERTTLLEPGQSLFVVIITAVFVIGGLAVLGLIGLAVMFGLSLQGRIGSLGSTETHHGIYAETFAVWLVTFFGMQALVGAAVQFNLVPASISMLAAVIGFFGSLIALAWPCVRGVPWRRVKTDIGWTAGRSPLAEPFLGLGGYAMGLPILAIGLGCTIMLVFIQQATGGEPPPFGSSAGPAHPVVAELGAGNWMTRIQILLLASVAAPIVEETMFRGVLYRHLRDASRRFGTVLSIMLSAALSSLVFAAIHPQGWVAIPALMSLAVAFSLAREWRGSLVVPMFMHGISNGVVMCLLMTALGVTR